MSDGLSKYIPCSVMFQIDCFRIFLKSNSYELINQGHRIMLETHAGTAIGFTDKHYTDLGVTVVDTAEQIYAQADMIVKVKEPQPSVTGGTGRGWRGSLH